MAANTIFRRGRAGACGCSSRPLCRGRAFMMWSSTTSTARSSRKRRACRSCLASARRSAAAIIGGSCGPRHGGGGPTKGTRDEESAAQENCAQRPDTARPPNVQPSKCAFCNNVTNAPASANTAENPTDDLEAVSSARGRHRMTQAKRRKSPPSAKPKRAAIQVVAASSSRFAAQRPPTRAEHPTDSPRTARPSPSSRS